MDLVISGLKNSLSHLSGSSGWCFAIESMSNNLCESSKDLDAFFSKIQFFSEHNITDDEDIQIRMLLLDMPILVGHIMQESTSNTIVQNYKKFLKIKGTYMDEEQLDDICAGTIKYHQKEGTLEDNEKK